MSVASPDHCTQRRPDIIDATSIIERFHPHHLLCWHFVRGA
jgi:hypothetical protein